MKQRGKKSLKAVDSNLPISAVERPEPPSDLTPEQRLEWIYVVNSVRADWFSDETHRMLAQYCKHVVTANHIAQLIEQEEGEKEIDLERYDKLLKMQERESRAILALARSMRLTQQATYHQEKTKQSKSNKAKAPWEE